MLKYGVENFNLFLILFSLKELKTG